MHVKIWNGPVTVAVKTGANLHPTMESAIRAVQATLQCLSGQARNVEDHDNFPSQYMQGMDAQYERELSLVTAEMATKGALTKTVLDPGSFLQRPSTSTFKKNRDMVSMTVIVPQLQAKGGNAAQPLLRSSPDSDCSCSFTGVADLAHASGVRVPST